MMHVLLLEQSVNEDQEWLLQSVEHKRKGMQTQQVRTKGSIHSF